MQSISKNQLKARMLAIFREIERTGEEVIVTDHSRPVLKITSLKGRKKSFAEVFGPYRGKIKYTEPLEESTEDEWGDLI